MVRCLLDCQPQQSIRSRTVAMRSCAVATITWPTAITPRVQPVIGVCIMILISRSHEDETFISCSVQCSRDRRFWAIICVFSGGDSVLETRRGRSFAAVQLGF